MRDSATLESILRTHSLVTKLQEAHQDVTFVEQVFDIAQKDRDENFTTGTLATPNCFAGSPAVAVSSAGKTVLALYYIGTGLTGHVGFAHGGSIATIMDECCGRTALCHFDSIKAEGVQNGNQPKPHSTAVTASLKVDYIAPVRTDSYVIVKGTVVNEGSSQRKANVTAQMWSTIDGNDTLTANAESLFIEPKM